jgi:hypothetical protein
VSLIGVGLGWYVHRREIGRREAALVATIRKRCPEAVLNFGPVTMVAGEDGEWDQIAVARDPSALERFDLRCFGTKHLSVVRIRGSKRCVNEVMMQLPNAEHLIYFSATWRNCDRSSCEQLSRLSGLQYLRIRGAQIDDGCLSYICRLKRLRMLDLTGTSITDKGLAEIAKLQDLELLSVADCPLVTGSGFRHFQKLPKLQYLSASTDQFTRESLQHLAGCRRLRGLDLDLLWRNIEQREHSADAMSSTGSE